MLRSAECSKCLYPLPLAPQFLKPSFPPFVIQCLRCQSWMKTTFGYRETWASGLIWIAGVWLSAAIAVLAAASNLMQGKGIGDAVGTCVVAFALLCFAFFCLSLFAALPLQLILEPITRAWGAWKEHEAEAMDISLGKKS